MVFYKRLLAGLSGAVFFSSISALNPNYFSVQLPIDLSLVARAGIIEGYVPPSGLQRIQRTEGAGSRGCSEAARPISLNLIVPDDHIGVTVSGHPTFLFHISEATSAPVRFTLVERGRAEPVLKKQINVENPGIVQLDLPPEVPELTEGKQYRWTVSIPCNEKRPSSDIFAEALIKRVASPSNLEQELGRATKEFERASIYAKNGIWYEASSIIYGASRNQPQEQLNLEYFVKLLNQVGLSDVASQEEQRLKKL